MCRVVAIIKDDITEQQVREGIEKLVGFSIADLSGKLVAINAPENSKEVLQATCMFKMVVAEVMYCPAKK